MLTICYQPASLCSTPTLPTPDTRSPGNKQLLHDSYAPRSALCVFLNIQACSHLLGPLRGLEDTIISILHEIFLLSGLASSPPWKQPQFPGTRVNETISDSSQNTALIITFTLFCLKLGLAVYVCLCWSVLLFPLCLFKSCIVFKRIRKICREEKTKG